MKMPLIVFVLITLFYSTSAAPQQPEITDQFDTQEDTTPKQNDGTTNEMENITEIIITDQPEKRQTAIVPQDGLTVKIYNFVTDPIVKILNAPKVNNVIRNIGTCVVNGAMELISYYLPAPFIPFIASAAGMLIPFEPIVMLKQRMPVTSYRRAFQTAMNTFMNTFEKYKVGDEFDPYMTRRFNRRYMDDKKD